MIDRELFVVGVLGAYFGMDEGFRRSKVLGIGIDSSSNGFFKHENKFNIFWIKLFDYLS